MKISGQPVANLVASTSGTDSDWVVKLIDVYPDEVAGDARMGGYQLMISADIFRGRYRESLETAKPIAAGQPLLYRFNLPTAESCISAGTSHHGADSVELVPAIRPQSANFREEHFLGEAGRLPQSDTARISRAGTGKLYRTAAGGAELRDLTGCTGSSFCLHAAPDQTESACRSNPHIRVQKLPTAWDTC